MPVPPHSEKITVPVKPAVQSNQTSFEMPVMPYARQSPSFWPSAPVVAAVLSKLNGPPPEIASGVAQPSEPPTLIWPGPPRGARACKPPPAVEFIGFTAADLPGLGVE